MKNLYLNFKGLVIASCKKYFSGGVAFGMMMGMVLVGGDVKGQIAAWDFYGQSSPATFASTTFNSNLISSGVSRNITRGLTAAASTATNSFRTIGFQNNGISTANTDYFQLTLTASTGYKLSLSSIDAKFDGTSTFRATPGVTSQFAYSLDGSTFTLIGSPSTSTSLTLPQIDLSGISALQNVAAGITVTIRYYASGQTTTGGWGFNSSASGTNGLAIGGTVALSATDNTAPTISSLSPLDDATNVAINSNLVMTFDENVKVGTGDILIKRLSDNTTVQTIDVTSTNVTISGASVTVNPPSDLSNSTGYYIELASGVIQDIAGNAFAGISGNSTWNFTTAAPTYTITVTQATGGTIAPGTQTGIASGANSSSFTATPTSCYTFDSWTIDGTANVSSANPYTFTNVTANHTLTAVYNIKAYGITASAGANGSVSPSGVTTINCGSDQTYTFNPNSGYAVDDVLIDGVSVGAVTTYSFTNVTAAHTISVSFKVFTGPCYSQNFTVGGGSQSIVTTVSAHCWTTSTSPAFTTTSSDHTTGGTGNNRGISMNTNGQWAQTPSLGGSIGGSIKYWTKSANTSDIVQSKVEFYNGGMTLLGSATHVGITNTWISFTDPLPNGTYYVRFLFVDDNIHYDDIEVNGSCSASPCGTNYYYRSKSNGPVSWKAASSWEQSLNGSTGWGNAIDYPKASALGVEVRTGHTIDLDNSGIEITNTNVFGTIRVQTSSSFDVSGDEEIELFIKNGGIFLVQNTGYAGTGLAYGIVESGGKLIAGAGCDGTSFVDDYLEEDNGLFYFADASICEWDNVSIYPNSNATSNLFFPYPAGSMPIFRITAIHPSYTYGNSSNANIIQAILEMNTSTSFKFGGNKTKTITGGIRSINPDGKVEQISGSGNILLGNISSPPPQVSSTTGNKLTLTVLTSGLELVNGGNVPSGSNVIIQPKINPTTESQIIGNNTGAGPLIIANNATLDITNMRITNGTNAGVEVNGTLRTSHTGGLYSTGSAIASGTLNINTGSTIDYYATTNQVITNPSLAGITGSSTVTETIPTAGTFQCYYNIIFSGAGTKTPSSYTRVHPSGSVKITGTTTVDFTGNNLGTSLTTNSTAFTMDGGRLILGTNGILPLMGGTYNINGGTIEYNNNASGIRTPNTYNNIEITVPTSKEVTYAGGNLTLNNNATVLVRSNATLISTNGNASMVGTSGNTLTLESGATFKTAVIPGFYGPGNGFGNPSASVRDNINIDLKSGSTIEYARQTLSLPSTAADGDQTITNIPVPYQNLTISGNGNKTAPSSTLTIKGNLTKTSTSIFKHNGGTVLFNGSLGQNFSNNSGFPMVFNNVTNESTGQGLVIHSDSMAIVRKLNLKDNSKLVFDEGNIILLSSDTVTANVAAINTGVISYSPLGGRFIVERYIKYTGNWNLIGSPTTEAQSIYDSWQEGGVNNTGYGTTITMPGIPGPGLDPSSVGHSLKWWDNSANANAGGFVGVENTITEKVNRPHGFYTFVRGDRSIGNGNTGGPTTLRSRGKIYSPALPFPDITATAAAATGYFISIANPFASKISFDKVLAHSSGIKDAYTVWDPTLGGSYGVGKYITYTKSTGWLPNVSAGLYMNTDSTLQSGQAFYVEADNTSLSTISFEENDKLDSSRLVNRGNGEPIVMMSTMLHNLAGETVDGNRVVFGNNYSNKIGREDAKKILNGAENFGLRRDNYTLAVEGHAALVESDSLFYYMSNIKTAAYKLSFAPLNLSMGLQAELIDNFLNSRTEISLTDSSWYNFSANADAASKASNRFLLVFKAAGGPLPVTLTQISAKRNTDQTITVNWKVEQEQQLSHYEVERSADGLLFTKIARISAANAAEYTQLDAQPLLADNYYRIKALSNDGRVQYSRIVKVAPVQLISSLTVFPNPVVKYQLQLQVILVKGGNYKIQLYNMSGQLAFEKGLSLKEGTQKLNIDLPKYLSKGNYHLNVNGVGGVNLNENILLQ